MAKEHKVNGDPTEGQRCYEEPSLNWLDEKLANGMLGGLKSGELEIYLAYMLMYQRGELNGDSFVLADKYRMPETKIRRLQVEFARRFCNENDCLKKIADGIFEKNAKDKIIPEVSPDGKKITFSVKNAAWIHALKRDLADKGLNWRDERNSRAITLDTYVFAIVFKDESKEFSSALGKKIQEGDAMEYIRKSYASCETNENEARKFSNWWKDHYMDVASVVSSAVGTVAAFIR